MIDSSNVLLKLQWNFNQNTIILIEENVFENVACKIWAILLRSHCVTKCRNIATASQIIMDNSFWLGLGKSLMGNVRHNVGNYAEINQMVLTCVYTFTLTCTCQVSWNPCLHNQSLRLSPRDHPVERLYVVFINLQEAGSAYAIPHEFLKISSKSLVWKFFHQFRCVSSCFVLAMS